MSRRMHAFEEPLRRTLPAVLGVLLASCAGDVDEEIKEGPLTQALLKTHKVTAELSATFVTSQGASARVLRCEPRASVKWTSWYSFQATEGGTSASADGASVEGNAQADAKWLYMLRCEAQYPPAQSHCIVRTRFTGSSLPVKPASAQAAVTGAGPIVYGLEGPDLESHIGRLESVIASGPSSCVRESFDIDWTRPARLTVTFE